ncbi:type I addiction module toxin, SymE family [Burkholderia sp. Bp8963]|uniref:SymE family type I addiction module toxin n=1 Tax=Burkholderia sp. Bp8963 TaxID=2184547 RepID=UPI000F5A189D|nr:SymE family type I addiction module toxin [Burkholderia sp. Bp8963]RQS60692.1 type I addiction module toxin, SymE family [Burkholderia sp. Bp8963]
MAKADHKSRPPITERYVTIQESWGFPKSMGRRPKSFYPWFRIGGMWIINDAGFVPGRKARITVEPGRLIITAM